MLSVSVAVMLLAIEDWLLLSEGTSSIESWRMRGGDGGWAANPPTEWRAQKGSSSR